MIVDRSDVGHLSALRVVSGIELLVDADRVWVRGSSWNEDLERLLKLISTGDKFWIDAAGLMTRWNETVPCDRLLDGNWRRIDEALSPELPVAGFATRHELSVAWRLLRDDEPHEASVLKTDWSTWRDYALNAPLVRLNRLTYAASSDGRALIRGVPLPPLPGQYYCEQHGIAVPAGWRLAPKVGSRTLRDIWKLNDDDFVLCEANGSYALIPDDQFVAATRSSIRLTDAAMTSQPSTVSG